MLEVLLTIGMLAVLIALFLNYVIVDMWIEVRVCAWLCLNRSDGVALKEGLWMNVEEDVSRGIEKLGLGIGCWKKWKGRK